MLMTPNRRHPEGELLRGPRTYRIGDADDAVGAELEQDAGQDHADRRRRLDVGVGQPGVEREHRHLDGEADEQEDEHRVLEARREERLRREAFVSRPLRAAAATSSAGLTLASAAATVSSAAFTASSAVFTVSALPAALARSSA